MKQRFVVMRDIGIGLGTHSVGEFETLDEANREVIKLMKREEDRLKLVKKTQPDLPRNALSYYRVEKR